MVFFYIRSSWSNVSVSPVTKQKPYSTNLFCYLYRQEALLAAISEKDANIALLELSSSKKKKTQEEVAALKREKDSLVQQLKQQVWKKGQSLASDSL